MRRVLLLVALLASSASATERFRLGARFGGEDIVTEWIELDPTKVHVQTDAIGGARLWDTSFEIAAPLEAHRITGRMFSPFNPSSGPVGLFVGERDGNGVRLTSDVVDQPKRDTTETWIEHSIFLPRGLLGYELVLRAARARGLSSMAFTWFDPQYRTETGRLEFVDAHHARFSMDESYGPMVDTFEIDDKGRITGGTLGVGGDVYRGVWMPEARRSRMPGK